MECVTSRANQDLFDKQYHLIASYIMSAELCKFTLLECQNSGWFIDGSQK